jgi:hypothetical protein
MFERGLAAIACGFVAALIACHQAHSEPTHSLVDHLGTYQFSERVSASGSAAETIDLEGNVVVTADTVTVDARPGPCDVDVNVTRPNPFTYRCGTNVVLSFDRTDPVGRAAYSAALAQNESHQVCARYEVDSVGRRYCAETQTITTQRIVRRSGRLRLTRQNG